MEEKHWLDFVTAIGSIATPIIVLIISSIGWKAKNSIERKIDLEKSIIRGQTTFGGSTASINLVSLDFLPLNQQVAMTLPKGLIAGYDPGGNGGHGLAMASISK